MSTRDAARSREHILAAAEARFAASGYTDTSLADIGTDAGLSRGAPGYFFGTKDALYAAVLTRVFAAREAALRPAFAPLAAWPHEDDTPLEQVLGAAIGAYLDFLHARPEFVALVEREALAGGRRLAAAPHASTAMQDAFAALRAAAPARGLRAFDPAEAVLTLVALTFFPLAHRGTFLPALGIDAAAAAFLQTRRDRTVATLLPMLQAA